MGDFNGDISRRVDGFIGHNVGYGVGQRNLVGRMLLEFCLEKRLCLSNSLFNTEEKSMVTFIMGENETEIECTDKNRTLMVFAKC